MCESALCTDIETNPGPVFYVDPSETISAPYSQGNQYIFGETAGQQCIYVLVYTTNNRTYAHHRTWLI